MGDGPGLVDPETEDADARALGRNEAHGQIELIHLHVLAGRVAGAVVVGDDRDTFGAMLVSGDPHAAQDRCGQSRLGLFGQNPHWPGLCDGIDVVDFELLFEIRIDGKLRPPVHTVDRRTE
ncbi:MAG: GNAT family N-acetyltransferase [Phycisphaerales bacterium]|nr:MAG: GNAT family N-acetyltransferase [Phycisphaerales bacterium]